MSYFTVNDQLMKWELNLPIQDRGVEVEGTKTDLQGFSWV